MIMIITYDLHLPNRDYVDVIAKIKSFGSWAHDEESVWLVDTELDAGKCRDALKSVTTDATFFVARLQCNWASNSLDAEVVRWLKSPNRAW